MLSLLNPYGGLSLVKMVSVLLAVKCVLAPYY
jgi:hypothetical protein